MNIFVNFVVFVAKTGDDPQEDFAKFGYKLNMKVIFWGKNILLYSWLPSGNHV